MPSKPRPTKAPAKPAAKPKPRSKRNGPPLAWLGELRPGAQGPAVLAAQVLLRAHGHQLGALDGSFGRETVRAVTQFRDRHDLPAGDRITDDVWIALAQEPDR